MKRARVLVVDDLPENREILTGLLEPEGHDMGVAVDGQEAVELALANPPDLIVMDVTMPRMSGFEACRRLKDDERTHLVPIVLVTGLIAREDRIEGIAASAAVMVAISGKTVQISDASYMMIHDPAVVVFMAMLDIETLKQLHESLKSIKDGIIPAYAQRSNLSEEVISRMMTKETWMSARDAVDYGFADEVISGGQSAKSALKNLAYVNALNFVNVPAELVSSEPEPSEDEREAQALRDYVQLYK